MSKIARADATNVILHGEWAALTFDGARIAVTHYPMNVEDPFGQSIIYYSLIATKTRRHEARVKKYQRVENHALYGAYERRRWAPVAQVDRATAS